MTTTQMTATASARILSVIALCARDIRAALKAAFPGVAFRVRSSSFSMGNSVSVSWVDGRSSDAVEALVSRFKDGGFDSSGEVYRYAADDATTPNRAMYVHCSREISPGIKAQVRE